MQILCALLSVQCKHSTGQSIKSLCRLRPQPGISLHCEITDTRPVHRAVCLFTNQLSLLLIALTHGRTARLSSQTKSLICNLLSEKQGNVVYVLFVFTNK